MPKGKYKPRGRPFMPGHLYGTHISADADHVSSDEEVIKKVTKRRKTSKEVQQPKPGGSKDKDAASADLGKHPSIDDISMGEFQLNAGFKINKDEEKKGVITRLAAYRMMRARQEEDVSNEYLIAHKESLDILDNKAHRGHFEINPTCPGFLKLELHRQVGVSGSWKKICDTCDYKSKPVELFVRQTRAGKGSRMSSLNLSVGLGLTNSGIAPSSMHEILLTMGIDPGSKTSLYSAHNRACDLVTEVGEKHLEAARQSVKGEKNLTIINDTQYTTKPGALDSPYVASSQAASTTMVKLKNGKFIVVDLQTSNKYCKRRRQMMIDHVLPDCPNHADGSKCTATMRQTDSISDEPANFRKTAKILKDAGLDIAYVCTDGDSKIGPVIAKEFGVHVVHFRDTRHLSSSFKRNVRNTSFSGEMFVGATNQKDKAKQKTHFSEALRQRVSFEHKDAVKQTKDLPDDQKEAKMNEILNNKPKHIVKCLKNDHSDCKEDLCKMWQKVKRTSHTNTTIEMNKADEKKVTELLKTRLGPGGVKKTWKNENTQASESHHRISLKCAPKHLKFRRNLRGRHMRACLGRNMGFANSTKLLLQSGGHAVSGKVKMKMDKSEKQRQQQLLHCKKPSVMKRRIETNNSRFWMYRQKGEKGQVYRKNSE